MVVDNIVNRKNVEINNRYTVYDKLYKIIKSDMSDYDKVALIDSIFIPSLVDFIDSDYKNRDFIISKIKEYQQKGLFRHTYHTSLDEVKERLARLNVAYDIINSDASEYYKLDRLLCIYKDSNDFKRQYSYMVKSGGNDPRLDEARTALDEYDYLYACFREYESKCSDFVKYSKKKESYYQNYKYAKFVVTSYVELESYKENIFFSLLGIDKNIFDFCVSTIEETDVELYKRFLDKKELNNKIRFIKNKEELSSLINDMKLVESRKFDVVEFLRRVPFKDSKNFISTLFDFVNRVFPEDYGMIRNYIYDNRLHASVNFKPVDVIDVYNTKTTVNGVEVTDFDKANIFNYIKVNNIPLVIKTYSIVLSRYMNGLITPEMVHEQCSKVNMEPKTVAVLIPSKRK